MMHLAFSIAGVFTLRSLNETRLYCHPHVHKLAIFENSPNLKVPSPKT